MINHLDFIENCVIGAGVVGLAIARSLAQRASSVVVLDKNFILAKVLAAVIAK